MPIAPPEEDRSDADRFEVACHRTPRLQHAKGCPDPPRLELRQGLQQIVSATRPGEMILITKSWIALSPPHTAPAMPLACRESRAGRHDRPAHDPGSRARRRRLCLARERAPKTQPLKNQDQSVTIFLPSTTQAPSSTLIV
jgi:hypothetical protein